MSDTDISLYPNKTIEQILGKQRELTPEEIAEIDAEAEKATRRFRKRMENPNNYFLKRTTINEKEAIRDSTVSFCTNAINTIRSYFSDLIESDYFEVCRTHLSNTKDIDDLKVESMRKILESITKIQDIVFQHNNTPNEHKEFKNPQDYIPLIKGGIYVFDHSITYKQSSSGDIMKCSFSTLNDAQLKKVQELLNCILDEIKEKSRDD